MVKSVLRILFVTDAVHFANFHSFIFYSKRRSSCLGWFCGQRYRPIWKYVSFWITLEVVLWWRKMLNISHYLFWCHSALCAASPVSFFELLHNPHAWIGKNFRPFKQQNCFVSIAKMRSQGQGGGSISICNNQFPFCRTSISNSTH